MFRKNLTQKERAFRLVVGLIAAFIGLASLGSNFAFGISMSVIGAIGVLSAAIGYCGIYALMGRKNLP
jgi:hypothetical protein